MALRRRPRGKGTKQRRNPLVSTYILFARLHVKSSTTITGVRRTPSPWDRRSLVLIGRHARDRHLSPNGLAPRIWPLKQCLDRLLQITRQMPKNFLAPLLRDCHHRNQINARLRSDQAL